MNQRSVHFAPVFALFLSFLTLAPSTWASGCIKGICQGSVVIDSANRVSKVDSISGAQASYTEISTGYSFTDSVSALSPAVASLGLLRPESTLIDENDRIGTANYVFADGRVDYTETSTGYDFVSKTVSPEVDSLSGDDFYKGHRVIDASDRVGLISHVFQDGRVSYTETSTGYAFVQSDSELSSEVERIGSIAAGVCLIDGQDRIGKVNYVFKDGRVDYTETSTGYGFISKSVVAETPSLRGGAIHPGSILIDSSDRIGRVEHAFADGRVDYVEISTGYDYVSKRVSPAVASLANDTIKSDKVVIDDSDRISNVKYTFADGRVDYVEMSTGYEYVSLETTLSPEVPTSPRYDKGQEYATANDQVGKPVRFFKDGRVELVTLEGYDEIETSLFAAVPSAFGFTAGALVSTSTLVHSTVAKVFENGALKLQTTRIDPFSKKPELVYSSAKGFGVDPAKIGQDAQAWLIELAQALEFNAGSQASPNPGSLAALSSTFPGVKAQLINYLSQHGKEMFDASTLSAVTAALNTAN